MILWQDKVGGATSSRPSAMPHAGIPCRSSGRTASTGGPSRPRRWSRIDTREPVDVQRPAAQQPPRLRRQLGAHPARERFSAAPFWGCPALLRPPSSAPPPAPRWRRGTPPRTRGSAGTRPPAGGSPPPRRRAPAPSESCRPPRVSTWLGCPDPLLGRNGSSACRTCGGSPPASPGAGRPAPRTAPEAAGRIGGAFHPCGVACMSRHLPGRATGSGDSNDGTAGCGIRSPRRRRAHIRAAIVEAVVDATPDTDRDELRAVIEHSLGFAVDQCAAQLVDVIRQTLPSVGHTAPSGCP